MQIDYALLFHFKVTTFSKVFKLCNTKGDELEFVKCVYL